MGNMSNWIWNLALGILMVVLGIFSLAYPVASSMGVSLFTAWFFVFGGIASVGLAIVDNESNGRLGTIILGVLMVIVGWFLLKYPFEGLFALSRAIGILLVATGVVKGYFGLKIVHTGLKWAAFFTGIVSVLLGFVVFRNPAIALGIWLGVELIVDGCALAALALARKMGGVSSTV